MPYYVNGIIDKDILEGVRILRDVVIYTITLRIGKVINGSPLCGVLLGNHTNRVTLKIREG